MARKLLPPGELLERIRAGMRGPDGRRVGCSDCVPTQLGPVRPVAGGVNWQVLAHPPCSAPCEAKMLDVCSALADEYDVLWPRDDVQPAMTTADAD